MFLKGRVVVGVLMAFALMSLVSASPSEAFSCSVTGTSGGNPGGEPIYTCTGLVEGDILPIEVNQTVGPDTLIASADITVQAINTGSVLLLVTIDNDSSGTNRITAFGLGIDPNATGGSVNPAGKVFDTFSINTSKGFNFPGFTLVEFCAAPDAGCAGSGGGLLPGASDSFGFALTGPYVDGGSISLSQFAFKFQGGAAGASYEKPGTPVPEPVTLLLLGTGLAAVGAATAWKRRSAR